MYSVLFKSPFQPRSAWTRTKLMMFHPRDRNEHRDDSFGAKGDARSDRKTETDAAVQPICPAQIPGQQMTCISAGDKRPAQVGNPLADL